MRHRRRTTIRSRQRKCKEPAREQRGGVGKKGDSYDDMTLSELIKRGRKRARKVYSEVRDGAQGSRRRMSTE